MTEYISLVNMRRTPTARHQYRHWFAVTLSRTTSYYHNGEPEDINSIVNCSRLASTPVEHVTLPANCRFIGLPGYERYDIYANTQAYQCHGCQEPRLLVTEWMLSVTPEDVTILVVDWLRVVVVNGSHKTTLAEERILR